MGPATGGLGHYAERTGGTPSRFRVAQTPALIIFDANVPSAHLLPAHLMPLAQMANQLRTAASHSSNPATAISGSRNGSRTWCIFKSHYPEVFSSFDFSDRMFLPTLKLSVLNSRLRVSVHVWPASAMTQTPIPAPFRRESGEGSACVSRPDFRPAFAGWYRPPPVSFQF